MQGIIKKASLSRARRHLLRLIQKANFGRIEGLIVREGEPVFEPPPAVVLEIKFGAENGPRPELSTEDFTLKTQVVEMFNHLSRLGNGTIQSLEVRHGLPFRMTVKDTTTP